MARRLDWRIGRLVKDAGGTPQQKDQLVAIATAAMADLKPMREQARACAPPGDGVAGRADDRPRPPSSSVRAAQHAGWRCQQPAHVQAMADAADVLTPEQRTKMADAP